MTDFPEYPDRKKRPSLRGSVMIDTVRGVIRIRKWPTKRKTLSARQRDTMETFRQANKLYQYIDPSQQMEAMEAAKGSSFYPRDLFLMASYGRLYRWTDTATGRKIYSMAARKDVSDSLDAIGQTEGDMLLRRATYWEALAPGEPGQVLAINPFTLQPQWMWLMALSDTYMLVRKTANQNIPNAADTQATFDEVVADPENSWDAALNRFRPGTPGWYVVIANARVYNLTNAFTYIQAKLRLNGTAGVDGVFQSLLTLGTPGAAIDDAAVPTSCLVYMNGSSDYIELDVYLAAGGGTRVLEGQATNRFTTLAAFRIAD